MLGGWATSILRVTAQENTEQLKEFLKRHPAGTLDMKAEVPVYGMEDDALEEAWGTSSLAVPLRPMVDGGHCLVFFFKTASTPPIKWVSRVAKKYPELSFSLRYAIPGVTIYGEYSRHGAITRTYEVEGDQQHVDEFLLQVE